MQNISSMVNKLLGDRKKRKEKIKPNGEHSQAEGAFSLSDGVLQKG